MKNKVQNILLVGVGGQGILLASEILSEVLMLGGYDVKKAEVHGMAQRGGSVVSHVRYGEKVYSPIIPEGEADILFGFELLESYRYLPLLKKDGLVVASDLQIVPPGVALGKDIYPEDIPAKICADFPRSRVVNAMDLAIQAGNMRTVNTVLLGTLSTLMDIAEESWIQAMNNRVPARFLDENLKAFALGRQA